MNDEVVKKEDGQANTVMVANTEVKNHAMDIYSKYLDHITSSPSTWKTTELPPSQNDVAISLGKITKKK